MLDLGKAMKTVYQPKITFITATFNSGKTLEQTISSIFNQTYRNIEYIIVDGGSTDGTLDILKKYGDNIRWISEPDNGICDAVGKGIDLATGDYINILGSDDALLAPHIIKTVVEQLQDKPDFLSCNKYNVDENTLLQYPVRNTNRLWNGLICIPTEGAYIGRRVLKKYPFDRHLKCASDYKLMIQCQLDETIKMKYCNLYTAFFSNSGTGSDQVLAEIEVAAIHKELRMNPKKYYGDVSQSWWFHIKKFVRNNLPFPLLLFVLATRKRILNSIFKILPQFAYCNYLRFKHPGAVPHTCDNKICRWCKRVI